MTTSIPRWTLHPVPGVDVHEVSVPAGVAEAARSLADKLEVPLAAVLLAAHAKVLCSLSGEDEVAAGYVATEGGGASPCRLTCAPLSWAGLVTQNPMAGSAPSGPFETVFDPSGIGGDVAGDAVLVVEVTSGPGGDLQLRLRYRTDVLDAPAAARIAGYHLRALALMTDDAGSDHGGQSLLSNEELEFQLKGLAGPSRPRPEARFHEMFEERVAAQPGAIAAACGGASVTYLQLNARANRLARALLAGGLEPESVVAVVTERNLNWMTAVLAVFKAGGAYLPIEPHFPPERIARMLGRAGCRLVLTEAGAASTTLDQALTSQPEVKRLMIDAASAEGDDADLGLDIGPDRLAYIYFTSGSTGEPKGAMCEHAGMLNHLMAKIEDLGIRQGDVVAQTAPQCFDISLWQLVSALLVGGRTLIVPQDVILDVQRFVEMVDSGRVAVAQVVPSYLEAVLSYLDAHPRQFPDLRCVSATGEALKKELAVRWFAAQPGIKLVNAYGLTETSDDTNHEVMDRPPTGTSVPLGRPVANVSVYVVDDNLVPVPLGAPGAIVFSGVCVGRGYVNDPERTRAAYSLDPYQPGARLYQAGDYGRWRADGKLEYLGRRDGQVKIRGFRIEIGEIENALLGVPGVGDGAVVVDNRNGSSHLVAFYSAASALPTETLEGSLGAALPSYMIPSAFHWREILPFTANGKIDRLRLTSLAGELATAARGASRARTPAEERLAGAWSQVLGIPGDGIDPSDNFFDLGGTSLSAVKLAVLLDRAVSLADLREKPVLADMAELIGRLTPAR